MPLRRRQQLWLGGALVALGVLGTAVLMLVAFFLGAGGVGPGHTSYRGARDFDSLGERIFLTGTDEKGDLIRRSGGMGRGGAACADCHGRDGKGRVVQMMMWNFESADIRWSTLSTEMPPEGDEESHPPFNRGSFARALREGVEPGGGVIEWPMPRWDLSDAQIDALVEYLKTL